MTFCPGYWDWLDQKAKEGSVRSTDSIYREITKQDDELSAWAKERKEDFISDKDSNTQKMLSHISDYIYSLENIKSKNRDDFLAGADPWLVAKAHSLGATVVTHENLVSNDSKKVKIPNICRHFEVSYLSPYQLLNELGARFVL